MNETITHETQKYINKFWKKKYCWFKTFINKQIQQAGTENKPNQKTFLTNILKEIDEITLEKDKNHISAAYKDSSKYDKKQFACNQC